MWINEYRNLRDQTPLDLGKNFPTLYKQLFDSINDEEKGVGIETKSRYALYLEEIGKKYFLKSRGKYGNMLNINQETLLNITALCIKDEKILLKQLFKEYERRGLYFDNYSKEEYFKKCLGKSFNQYLLDLQIKVIVPFYGIYYSISFYKRFDKYIQKGYSRQMALWLTTLEEN